MLLLPCLIHSAAAAQFFAQPPLVDYSPFHNDEGSTSCLNNFIITESPIALQAVLNNIGSKGALAPGVEAGLVVGSPSNANPDC